MSTDLNGSTPSWEDEAHRLDDVIDVQRTELRELLASERALVGRIQEALDACKEREKRVLRALAALEGTAVGPGRRPKGSTGSGKTATWVISEKKVNQSRDALVALGGQARGSEVAERAGISSESARRALTRLREAEEVRIVSHDAKLGATFALMPNTDGAWVPGENDAA